jgi:hypothetical protein
MTALKKYQRIESVGLWRASAQEQRREVVVSIGDATLIISDMNDSAVAHWSLAAIERANPGKRPAIFYPAGDPGETLELAKSEKDMIDAIEKLRRAVDRARPKPGRLRWLGVTASVAAVAALAVFWLPGAVVSHAVTILPDVKRNDISRALRGHIERLTGAECRTPDGLRALSLLSNDIGVTPLGILPSTGANSSISLPNGRIMLNRNLVEDFEDPAVVAGFAVAERVRTSTADPLAALLQHAGTWDSLQLMATGRLQDDALRRYAEHLLTREVDAPETVPLLKGFRTANISSAPYAYAQDITGETVLPLIEGDPTLGQQPRALLSDADWLRLQSICGN